MTILSLYPTQLVAEAEQEALEASQLADTLEESIQSGADAEEAESARRLLGFVRLHQQAVKRQADVARRSCLRPQ